MKTSPTIYVFFLLQKRNAYVPLDPFPDYTTTVEKLLKEITASA